MITSSILKQYIGMFINSIEETKDQADSHLKQEHLNSKDEIALIGIRWLLSSWVFGIVLAYIFHSYYVKDKT